MTGLVRIWAQMCSAVIKSGMRNRRDLVPCVVEFTGVAGVGKTVVARRVAEFVRSELRHRQVLSKHDPLTIARALLSPRALLHTLSGFTILMRAEPWSPGRMIRQANKWSRISYKLWGCRSVHAIHLVDHGFFQTLRGIGSGSRRDMHWIGERLFSRVTRPDLVVVLRADAQCISLRRQAREKTLNVVDPDGPINAVGRMPEFARFVDALGRRHGTVVLHVQNGPNEEVANVAKVIFQKIIEMIGEARQP